MRKWVFKPESDLSAFEYHEALMLMFPDLRQKYVLNWPDDKPLPARLARHFELEPEKGRLSPRF
jgi:hypothetical protein